MKSKKWLLLLIIVFPSLFWLILETSTINSKKLPYYGKKEIAANGDTVYQTTNTTFYTTHDSSLIELPALSTDSFGVFALILMNEKYRKDAFRIAGLSEYLTYKKSKIAPIPIVIITPFETGKSKIANELDALGKHGNVHFYHWKTASYDSLIATYFIDKPYYIDSSFFMLIDTKRHIRGYYDSRYASEMKRLIGEYEHLRLKEEKQNLIKTNEIKSNS